MGVLCACGVEVGAVVNVAAFVGEADSVRVGVLFSGFAPHAESMLSARANAKRFFDKFIIYFAPLGWAKSRYQLAGFSSVTGVLGVTTMNQVRPGLSGMSCPVSGLMSLIGLWRPL